MQPQIKSDKKPRRNILKDKRSYWLTHEAFLFIQALAEKQGISSSAYLEILSRELAHQKLTEDQIAGIVEEAQVIIKRRLDSN